MDISKINKGIFTRIAFIVLIITAISCKDEEETFGTYDNASLDALITQAENLIATTEEGIAPGLYQPGSKAELQEVIDWAIWRKTHSKKQTDIAAAARRLQRYIEIFENNVVTVANPWIRQDEAGTNITISDNLNGDGVAGTLHGKLAAPFTLEGKFYIVDLNPWDFAQNLFATVADNATGFNIRLRSNGSIAINLGAQTAWNETQSNADVIRVGQWHHVSFVYTSNTSQQLYVDGTLVVESSLECIPSAADVPLVLGNLVPWNARLMNGMVADFRLWTEARTATQISDNLATKLTGDESNLEVLIPFNANLGTEFADVSNKYLATLNGSIEWVPEGTTPEITIDYSGLNAAIASAQKFSSTITSEGTNDGDYPVGSKAYIDTAIADAQDILIATSIRQDQVDAAAENLQKAVVFVETYTVTDAYGIYIDRNNASAVGFDITPNYTPQGDYTVEFDVFLKTLKGVGSGEVFCNGSFGFRVHGYAEDADESEIINAGHIWNFNATAAGWIGPESGPGALNVGAWKHVAIIHDDAAQTTRVVIDGTEVAAYDTIPAPNVSGDGFMRLGGWWAKIDGSMKDFRIWDEVRSEAQLDAEITGTEPNLQLYFPLDRVGGISLSDVTGTYKGTMNGIRWNLISP